MTKKPSIASDCPIDVDKLIESRLVVQANSGGGKSWLIRRLAEQTYGHVQQIIIDHDGEYHTLCEKFDYVLARKGGEAPADIKSAAMLARKLLELGVSAIIDIYELGMQRAEFVRRFLDSLVNAPRELWHPVLVIVDEAHLYAPEKGSAVSLGAVNNLMALGRKRGFAGCLATQRIAKLSKDAIAECNSKLIGRAALDVDMKRAANELGFSTREDTLSLRTLKPGQFYVFGPAFTDQIKLVQVGGVQTTHLRAGQRSMPPTPPREKVKAILGQLANLPREAEEEAKTLAELRAQVTKLKGDLTRAKSDKPEAKTETIEKPVVDAKQLKQLEAICKRVEGASGDFGRLRDKLSTSVKALAHTIGDLRGAGSALSIAIDTAFRGPAKAPARISVNRPPTLVASGATVASPVNGTKRHPPIETNGELPKGEAAVLRAAIQFPGGLQKRQLTVLTGYKRSTRDAYILRLRDRGFLVEQDDKIFATPEGIAFMPNAEPLPTGEALRDFWYRELPSGERAVLELLVGMWPETMQKQAIDDATGFKRSTRDAYLLRLGGRELVVEVGRGEVKAADSLFEVK